MPDMPTTPVAERLYIMTVIRDGRIQDGPEWLDRRWVDAEATRDACMDARAQIHP